MDLHVVILNESVNFWAKWVFFSLGLSGKEKQNGNDNDEGTSSEEGRSTKGQKLDQSVPNIQKPSSIPSYDFVD